MIRIGRAPVLNALPLLLGMCVPVSLLFAWGSATPFDAGWVGYLVALACWLAVLPGAIALGLRWWYRPVAFDPRSGTARLGRVTVPLATVTTARREMSTAPNATYVSYRFESTDGAWGRVLVAGRPMRGLDAQGRQRLAQFIEAAGIQSPADQDGLTPDQRVLAEQLSQTSTKSVVGKEALLAELRGELTAASAAGRAQPAAPEQLARDDRDAEAFRQQHPEVGRTARRVFGWSTLTAVVGGFAVAILGAAAEPADSAIVGTGVVAAIAVALVSYVGYCVAHLVHLRHAQWLSLTWLRGRDADQAARGLPPPLLAPFLGPTPGQPLMKLVAYVAAVFATVNLIAAPVVAFVDLGEPRPPPVLGLVVLLVGLWVMAVAIVLYVHSRRGRRRQDVRAIQLAGSRIYAEALSDRPDADAGGPPR